MFKTLIKEAYFASDPRGNLVGSGQRIFVLDR